MRTEMQTTVPVLKQRIGDWLSLTSVSVKGRLILHCCNADSKNMELNNLTSYAIRSYLSSLMLLGKIV